jgi:NADH:ubiquinone oxidoreductase subunit E
MDMKKVDEIIDNHQIEKGALLSILHDIQEKEGYLPDTSLYYLSHKLHIPISEIFRVATYFEKTFSLEPKGKHTIKICQGTTCYLKDSDQVLTEIKEELDKNGEEKDFSLEKVRCLGCCDSAPVVEIDEKILDRESAKSTIIKLKGEK